MLNYPTLSQQAHRTILLWNMPHIMPRLVMLNNLKLSKRSDAAAPTLDTASLRTVPQLKFTVSQSQMKSAKRPMSRAHGNTACIWWPLKVSHLSNLPSLANLHLPSSPKKTRPNPNLLSDIQSFTRSDVYCVLAYIIQQRRQCLMREQLYHLVEF